MFQIKKIILQMCNTFYQNHIKSWVFTVEWLLGNLLLKWQYVCCLDQNCRESSHYCCVCLKQTKLWTGSRPNIKSNMYLRNTRRNIQVKAFNTVAGWGDKFICSVVLLHLVTVGSLSHFFKNIKHYEGLEHVSIEYLFISFEIRRCIVKFYVKYLLSLLQPLFHCHFKMDQQNL